jgi:hypothetical protein
MARSRNDASDETREGAEARRATRSLIDPDRALERRQAADAARKTDPPKETQPVGEGEVGERGGTSETSRPGPRPRVNGRRLFRRARRANSTRSGCATSFVEGRNG